MRDSEIMTWVVIGIVIFALLGGIGMMGFRPYGFGGMMHGSYGTGAMLFGWLYGILILIVLVLFIIWIAKKFKKNRR